MSKNNKDRAFRTILCYRQGPNSKQIAIRIDSRNNFFKTHKNELKYEN